MASSLWLTPVPCTSSRTTPSSTSQALAFHFDVRGLRRGEVEGVVAAFGIDAVEGEVVGICVEGGIEVRKNWNGEVAEQE